MRNLFATTVVCLQASFALAADLPRAVIPEDFPIPGATSVLLGRDLFFDPVLSGNRNIACATCHSPAQGSGDGVSLSLGEGARGLGPARTNRPQTPAARLARNTPALFNLGAHEFKTMFHDGRVEVDETTRFGFRLPKGSFLERPLPSALAAQALMPLVTHNEMAGQPGANPVSDAVAQGRIIGLGGAWDLLARRIDDIPEYRDRFSWLIGEDEPLHITHIAQVLADFITYEFRATDTPFDAFLRGDDLALQNGALHGMSLFYGKAGCATCHSGPFQTDHKFHAIGLPQIGPGKGHGPAFADHGRGAITGKASDTYRFRTPSLRNVTLTAPYGHNGAFSTLEAMIRHHSDPMTSLAEYTGDEPLFSGAEKPEQGAMADFDEVLNIAAAIEIPQIPLTDSEIAALVSFLNSLTDPVSKTGRLGLPETVPSGLPVEGATRAPS